MRAQLFQKYKWPFLIILLVSIGLVIIQYSISDLTITFFSLFSRTFSLLFFPIIGAAFLVGVMWYLGRHINSKKIFISYLVSWAALAVFTTITIIKIYS